MNPRRNTIADFHRRINKTDTCWLWTGGTDKNGYGRFQFEGKLHYTHRLSYTIFKAPLKKGMGVLHKCDNPTCVNPDHLFEGTQTDNVKDMRDKERCAYGEKAFGAKLTIEKVRDIRQRAALGGRGMARILAAEYDMSKTHMNRIIKGTRGNGLCWPDKGEK